MFYVKYSIGYSHKDHVTNEEVCVKIQQAIGSHEDLLTIVKRRTLQSCLPFIRSGQNHLARHREKGKKAKQTEKEAGRQLQGMARSRVREVPENSGKHRKMEETGRENICGAPSTSAVKGYVKVEESQDSDAVTC